MRLSLTNREILAIAVPAIVSNITTPLLAMVDTTIVGHLGSATFIGAIAVGGSMFNMLYWLFNFLRMGSSGMTAIAYGRGDRHETDSIFYRAVGMALMIGLAISILRHPLAAILLDIIDADEATRSLAADYFMIAVTGAPATLGVFALSGWFLGMQDSRTPMWMAIVTNVVNIPVSIILVFGFGMRIEGVATGSAAAQWSGLIFGLIVAFVKYRPGRPDFKTIIRADRLKRFFMVNTDIFLRTLCLVTVTVWFTRAGAEQGVVTLAANALLMQMFLFFSYFMDGFAFAGEALAGKNAGRGDSAGLSAVIKALGRWGTGIAIAFAALYLTCGNLIVTLLTDNAEVIRDCRRYLLWAAAVPLAGVTAFIWDGILIGMTRTRLMLLSMAVSMAVFFAIYYLLTDSLGNHGLWIAFVSYLAVRGLVEYFCYRRRPARFVRDHAND